MHNDGISGGWCCTLWPPLRYPALGVPPSSMAEPGGVPLAGFLAVVTAARESEQISRGPSWWGDG